jgi:hypothetical protein
MAQETLRTRKRLARIISICGLFLLSAAFAALPVAADKGGGNDRGDGNKVETGQMHDRDNHGQGVADKDVNDHHDMVDNDANEHHDMADNDANDDANERHDAVDNDTNEPPATADNDANDNDDDDVAMPMMAPAP